MKERIQSLQASVMSTPRDASATVEDWAGQAVAKSAISLPDENYEFPEDTPDTIPQTTYQSLAQYGQNPAFWNTLLANIDFAMGSIGMADTKVPLQETASATAASSRPNVGATLIDKDNNESIAPNWNAIITEAEFFNEFRRYMATTYANDPAARYLAQDIVEAAYAGPTLVYNRELTQERRELASSGIEPLRVQVNKGETIIGKDEIVTQLDIQKLEAMQERMKVSLIAEIGYFIFASLFVLIVFQYIKAYYKDITRDTRRIAVIFIAIIMLLGIARVIVHLSLLDLGTNTLKHVGYAIPLGALGVIITLLTGARLAVFCCATTALYMEFVLRGYTGVVTLPYVLLAFVTACGSIYTVTRIRRRSDLYRAGAVTIFLGSLVIVAVALQQYTNLESFIQQGDELKWAFIWSAVNGGLVSILSIALMPIFEDLYGITTDIKLLELSQKNELLQRLEQEAPGSYQHSMRVATLAETAADAIGANALLVKVGAYYHDIGKMVKPLYFVENQQTVADKAKHSKISPNMSCLIIRNHVKNGLDLADQYKLPKVIRDFIPEHHGTTLMTYFYHQALSAQETGGTIREEDFRYPGPKPQSKETAILMLADALEASSRVLDSPNESNVRQLVRKIINERFMDGQFNECNLTLKDLHTLYQIFSDTLMHMMHQRIAYPSAPVRVRAEEAEDVQEDLNNAVEQPVAIKEKSEPDGASKPAESKDKSPGPVQPVKDKSKESKPERVVKS